MSTNTVSAIPQPLPLEDAWNDVLNKAVRGVGIDDKNLAPSANIIPSKLKSILEGELPSDDTLRRLAIAVGLRPTPFLEIAHKNYKPKLFDAKSWSGVAHLPSRYMDYFVNCYLVWDVKTKEAVLFDTGTDFESIRKCVSDNGLKLSALYITHIHGDHIAILDEIVKAYQPNVFAPKFEPVSGATLIEEGAEFTLGSIKGKALLTDGHSVGHLTYVLTSSQWSAPVAIVGDALFAGSMGGGMISYTNLKKNVQEKILKLSPAALLCPGHGPTTTVQEENNSNPFA